MTKKELQARLLKAFADVKHPGNRRLLREDLPFPHAYIIELEFLFRYEGRPWYEIDKRTLLREDSCFSSLSDAGILYIIPAYLYHCYNPNTWFDSFNSWEDRLLELLSQKGRGDLRFTPDQLRIISDVFLNELQREWDEVGELASAYGNDFGQLIAEARSIYKID